MNYDLSTSYFSGVAATESSVSCKEFTRSI